MEQHEQPQSPSEEQQKKLGKAFGNLLTRLNERLGSKVPCRISLSELADPKVLNTLISEDTPAVIAPRGIVGFVLLPLTSEDEGNYAFERMYAVRAEEIHQARVEGELAMREGRVVAPPLPGELPS